MMPRRLIDVLYERVFLEDPQRYNKFPFLRSRSMNTAASAPQFKRKKLLTRPILKFIKDIPVYIRCEGAIYLGKEMKQQQGEKKKEPAHLADVIDLSTGEVAQIIVNAVPMSVLKENYPEDSYVGKCFAITRQSRKEGKAYDPFNVEEIEDPSPSEKKGETQTISKGDVGEMPASILNKGSKK